MIKFFILFYIFLMTLNTPINASNNIQENLNKNKVMIGFYGRPYASSLGILGKNSIDELVNKMRVKEQYYKNELNNKIDIELAFHIIHSLATKDEGRRKDYLLNMSEETVAKYINRAKKEGFAVILDVQLATKTALQAVKPILKYLKYDNVHIAIDPEFKIPHNGRYPPGKFIGHIYADDLNNVQDEIQNYLEKNNIKGKRKLIVHMFLEKMLREKEKVKKYDNIDLIYNIDGHGKGRVKIKIYNSLYAKKQTHKAIGGFKIFYNSDTKPLLTPKQILGLEAVLNERVMTPPYYINYH